MIMDVIDRIAHKTDFDATIYYLDTLALLANRQYLVGKGQKRLGLFKPKSEHSNQFSKRVNKLVKSASASDEYKATLFDPSNLSKPCNISITTQSGACNIDVCTVAPHELNDSVRQDFMTMLI